MPLDSPEEYEQYIYAIPNRYSSVRTSTLVLIRTGRTAGELRGYLFFEQGIMLGVSEEIDFKRGAITSYSYWVSKGAERLYWYDSQPHPNDSTLAVSHPHHKHIHPDIKHHRIPAPGLSFIEANLSYLIEEIEATLLEV